MEANVTRMPKWNQDIINGKPAVEFSGILGHSLSLQINIDDPTYIFIATKQNQSGESQIVGGDLFTTNEYGFFTLNYNSQNPFISSSDSFILLVHLRFGTQPVLKTCGSTENLWVLQRAQLT